MRDIISILRDKGYDVTLAHDLPNFQEYQNFADHIHVIGMSHQYITGDGSVITKSKHTVIQPDWRTVGNNLRCELFHFMGEVPGEPLPEGFTMFNGFQVYLDIYEKPDNVKYNRFEYARIMKQLRKDLQEWACHVSACMVKINGAINETIYETG